MAFLTNETEIIALKPAAPLTLTLTFPYNGHLSLVCIEVLNKIRMLFSNCLVSHSHYSLPLNERRESKVGGRRVFDPACIIKYNVHI